jgi:hypothetical protein
MLAFQDRVRPWRALLRVLKRKHSQSPARARSNPAKSPANSIQKKAPSIDEAFDRLACAADSGAHHLYELAAFRSTDYKFHLAISLGK